MSEPTMRKQVEQAVERFLRSFPSVANPISMSIALVAEDLWPIIDARLQEAERWRGIANTELAAARSYMRERDDLRRLVRWTSDGCVAANWEELPGDLRRVLDAALAEQNRPSGWCSQCGQWLSARACGPTHAVLAAEQNKRAR